MLQSQVTSKSAWDGSTVVKRMLNYGCHCFPDNTKRAGGKGPVQDGYDALCKNLAKCQRCIEMDFVIDPYATRYKWFVDSNTKEIRCSHPRNTELQRSLCECDAKFAMDMGMVWEDNKWNSSLWHHRRNSDFSLDTETVCVGMNNGVENDNCCGDYRTFLVN